MGVNGAGRLLGIDLARCLALLSMFVAHLAPSPGPYGVLNISEFLTAALFAMLIGISADLSRQRMNFPTLLGSSVVRGLALIALGLWLDMWNSQVSIVLEYLGVLCIFVAVMVFMPTWLNLVLALACWWLSPLVVDYFLPVHQQLVTEGSMLSYLTSWLFAGMHYRVITMLVWAGLGIVLIRWMQALATALQVLLALLVTTLAGATWWYAHLIMDFFPYSGNRWEVGFDALLAAATIFWCSVLGRLFAQREEALSLLSSTGRMTLTLYVMHVGILALYNKYALSFGVPANDDSWAMLAILVGSSLLFTLLWKKLLGHTPLYRGPFESLLAGLTGRS